MPCETKNLKWAIAHVIRAAKDHGICENCVASELIEAAVAGVMGLECADRTAYARSAIEGFMKVATMPQAPETRQ